MPDLEFTIQEGKLYMLQTRVGKRTGIAAVRIAYEMVNEGRHHEKEAVMRVSPDQLSQYLYPIFDTTEGADASADRQRITGRTWSGSRQTSRSRPIERSRCTLGGSASLLVRQETSPDDIHGMHAAQGFLTARGGMTLPCRVVARQMGKVVRRGMRRRHGPRAIRGCVSGR